MARSRTRCPALPTGPGATGERPPVTAAEGTVSGADGRELARARTDSSGVAGLPLAADVPPRDVLITVRHQDYNPRHLRLDGSSVALELRELLYGGSETTGA